MSLGQFVRRLRRLHHSALDVVFPPQCIGCGLVGCWVCDRCRPAIPFNRPPGCQRCGRALAANTRTCGDCRDWPAVLNRLRSPYRYDGAIRDALHRLKYNGVTALAGPLVDLAWPEIEQFALAADVVVPVPLHPRRERERGYNQAHVIARALGERARIPIERGLLRKVRHTASQVALRSRDERRRNVVGAFHCRPMPGRRVLLVDDLATTGSTLGAAASAVAAAGATEVIAFTLARET